MLLVFELPRLLGCAFIGICAVIKSNIEGKRLGECIAELFGENIYKRIGKHIVVLLGKSKFEQIHLVFSYAFGSIHKVSDCRITLLTLSPLAF